MLFRRPKVRRATSKQGFCLRVRRLKGSGVSACALPFPPTNGLLLGGARLQPLGCAPERRRWPRLCYTLLISPSLLCPRLPACALAPVLCAHRFAWPSFCTANGVACPSRCLGPPAACPPPFPSFGCHAGHLHGSPRNGGGRRDCVPPARQAHPARSAAHAQCSEKQGSRVVRTVLRCCACTSCLLSLRRGTRGPTRRGDAPAGRHMAGRQAPAPAPPPPRRPCQLLLLRVHGKVAAAAQNRLRFNMCRRRFPPLPARLSSTTESSSSSSSVSVGACRACFPAFGCALNTWMLPCRLSLQTSAAPRRATTPPFRWSSWRGRCTKWRSSRGGRSSASGGRARWCTSTSPTPRCACWAACW